MSVYFHANFGLNRSNMAKLLNLALENPARKDKELARRFGYGEPFAARTRSWLHKTGFIELGFPISLTQKGVVVFENDPKFETLHTQWFMHKELTEHPTRAEAWHYFIYEFLPKHAKFTRDQLIDGLTMKLRVHSEEHFGPGSKLNIVIARKMIECYSESYALGNLEIIRKEVNGYIRG